MKFNERKEWLFDPEVFGRADSKIALGIHAEYVKASSGRPYPKFFEVDRRSEKIDDLWHVSLDERTVFSRTFEMPAIVQAERPDWRLTRVGLVPQQKMKFWCANSLLEQADYFPVRGDMIFYNGYRNMVVKVVLEPNAFWQQTNLWLGLVLETIIPAEGDARPLTNQGVAVPRELMQTRALPEV